MSDFGELSIWIDGERMAHDLEHGYVGLGVRVREGRFKINAGLFGELAHRHGLIRALGEEFHLTGELAELVDL